jgi:hypothetical protein
LNPEVVNPVLIGWLGKLRTVLPFAAALAMLALLASLEFNRWRARHVEPQPLVMLTRFLAGVTVITLLSHWLAFHTAHLLLPKDRTGLFFVVLSTLVFGAALAHHFASVRPNAAAWLGIGTLTLVAIYFGGCLRLGYFREWDFDADTKRLYWAAVDLNRRCGISEFVTDWKYPGPLEFYRRSNGNSSLREFRGAPQPLPAGQNAYVLYFYDDENFVAQQGLHVIYRSERTDAVVAIRSCGIPPRHDPQ